MSSYAVREKAIAGADAGGIRERWEYGRLLLVDDTKTTPAGHLRHGVLADLIRAALKIGRKVSEREIRYRLECAKAYPCESQIRHAGADFECWTDLRSAGFPPYPAAEGERPYDPRTTRQLAVAQDGAGILPEPWEQRGLFERFDDDATLGAMKRYADEQHDLNARFARRCDERSAYLDELVKAVHGDLSKTWAQARDALGAA